MRQLPRTTSQQMMPGADSSKRALSAIILIGIGLRLYHLFQPLRYDEAMGYLLFVRLPWAGVVSDYHLPNNHIFHTLLVKAFLTLLGNHPWVLRLPVFIAGCCAIPLTFLVAERVTSTPSALIATALVSASGALTLYSTNARGYALIVDATLLLCWIAQLARSPRRWHLPIFASVTALGLWTIPTMLYSLGGVLTWSRLDAWYTRRDGRDPRWWRYVAKLTLAASVGGALAGLLYLPVFVNGGVGQLVRNKYVAPSGTTEFIAELATGLKSTWNLFALGLPPLAPALLVACAILGVVIHLRRGQRGIPLLLPVAIWCVVLLLLMRRFPFARVWIFLIPFVAISAADGIVWLLERSGHTVRWYKHPLVPVGLACVLAAYLLATRAILNSRETGSLPDAEQIALRISQELRPGDRILAATFAPLAYWLERTAQEDLIVMGEAAPASRFLVVVNEGEDETLEQALSRFGPLVPRLVSGEIAEFPHAKLYAVTLN